MLLSRNTWEKIRFSEFNKCKNYLWWECEIYENFRFKCQNIGKLENIEDILSLRPFEYLIKTKPDNNIQCTCIIQTWLDSAFYV